MDPADLHDLTAAYALDALDADEVEAYEAHLAQCERCRQELAQLGETAASLAWGVESPPPPALLRARILAEASAGRSNVIPLPVRRPWLVRAAAAAAAAAACVAVGLGVWAGVLSQRLHDVRSASATDARAVEILSDQASRRIGLRGASGVLAVDPTGQGVLVVRRLAPAPAGKTYEAWVIPHGDAAQPAGTFAGGPGTTIVPLGRMIPQGATVAVTIERAGGAGAPTQAPVLRAQA
ncbi:MAG: anti-sigma factor [Gaiellaceae bacterium]